MGFEGSIDDSPYFNTWREKEAENECNPFHYSLIVYACCVYYYCQRPIKKISKSRFINIRCFLCMLVVIAAFFSVGAIASVYYYHISDADHVSKIILYCAGSCCLLSYICILVIIIKIRGAT